MKESTIERKVCAWAKRSGLTVTKLVTPGETGYPDRIFWLPGGKPLLIEFKKPGETPRPKQLYIIHKLQQLGYQVEIHDDADAAIQSITKTLATSQLSEKGG